MHLFCERCTCQEARYFTYQLGQWVCRRCLGFNGQDGHSLSYDGQIDLAMPFELSPQQKQLSKAIALDAQHHDVLVHAVCGAGKTELMYETIQQAIHAKQKIAIAVARRQVVLQLYERLQSIFKDIKVIALCEGHTDDIEGHLIICTTHQLYRFHQTLDILILDEPDAYPFNSEAVLQGFAKQACKGHTIYLSATPSKDMLKAVQKNQLVRHQLMHRPHKHPLPEPRIRYGPLLIHIAYILYYLNKQSRPVLIFVPTLRLGRYLKHLLNLKFVNANHPELDSLIKDFQENPKGRLLTSTVLERGVTFKGVQVIIIQADHPVFDEASLIQIAGRVGRDMHEPTGEVIFLCTKMSSVVRSSLQAIQKANRTVSYVSNPNSMGKR